MTPGIANHRTRRTLPYAVAVAALAMTALAAAPAQAVPSPREVHREIHGHVHDVLRELVHIPARIHDRHRAHLQVFFGGDAYYAPHRHSHRVYRYPVWVGEHVYYRPYHYCGDHLFTQVQVRPRFWSDWGYEPQGRWCGHHRRYYPARHSCFHGAGYSAPRRHEHRHDRYCGHDSGYGGGHGGRYDRHDAYDRHYRQVRFRYDDESYRYDDDGHDDRGKHGKGGKGKKGKHNGRHGR